MHPAAAAAAAKSLQSCPTLCDPIDGSPSGGPVPGILQARTLERVAISFSKMHPRAMLLRVASTSSPEGDSEFHQLSSLLWNFGHLPKTDVCSTDWHPFCKPPLLHPCLWPHEPLSILKPLRCFVAHEYYSFSLRWTLVTLKQMALGVKNKCIGTCLVVQWLRLQLPLQEVQAWSLFRELRSHMSHGQKVKTQSRSSVVTNLMKTLKTVLVPFSW